MEEFLPWLMLLIVEVPGQPVQVERVPQLSLSLQECEARGHDHVLAAPRRHKAGKMSIRCMRMPPAEETDRAWQRVIEEKQREAQP